MHLQVNQNQVEREEKDKLSYKLSFKLSSDGLAFDGLILSFHGLIIWIHIMEID